MDTKWHGRWVGATLEVWDGDSLVTSVHPTGSNYHRLQQVMGAVAAKRDRPAISEADAQRVVVLAAGDPPPEPSLPYRGLSEIGI